MRLFIDIFTLSSTVLIALFIYLYYSRKYCKERNILLKLYVYGMLVSLPTIFFEKVLISFDNFSFFISGLYRALVVAGYTEEFFKRFVIISLAYKKIEYNKKFTGIVYAVITALGFATMENFLYVAFNYQSYQIGITRTIISVTGHILFAVTMGYYLSLAKFSLSKGKREYYFILSLITPIILHGIFDFIIYVEAYVLLPVFIIFLIILYIFNIRKLQYFFRKEQEKNKLEV